PPWGRNRRRRAHTPQEADTVRHTPDPRAADPRAADPRAAVPAPLHRPKFALLPALPRGEGCRRATTRASRRSEHRYATPAGPTQDTSSSAKRIISCAAAVRKIRPCGNQPLCPALGEVGREGEASRTLADVSH